MKRNAFIRVSDLAKMIGEDRRCLIARLQRRDDAIGGGILSVLAYGPKGRHVWGVSWDVAREIVREKRLEPVDREELARVSGELERVSQRLGRALKVAESLEKRILDLEESVTKP